MQLGVRWRSGEPPHRSVPPALHEEIVRQEAAFPGAGHWTLTWLENRPRLVLDDLVRVELTAAGVVEARPVSASADDRGGQADTSGGEPIEVRNYDDDDDDWLN